MPNLTTNYDFNKPLVNNATDADLWGGYLNDNWDSVDALLPQTTSSKSATFNVGATEFNYTYLVDASGGAVTANLPAVSSVYAGFVVRFKLIDATAALTIDPNGSETIDGASTFSISAVDDTATVVCDGTNWQITTKSVTVPILSQFTDGAILQRQISTYSTYSSASTAIPIDDTIPQNTEGDEIMTVSITPQSTSSIIRIKFNGVISSSANSDLAVALFKDSDADAIHVVSQVVPVGNYQQNFSFEVENSPATVSSVTYKIRVGANTGTVYINGKSTGRIYGGSQKCVLIAEEIYVS